ncbi:membrane hypothetical protein [Hyphomicrobiales bacterium]|nr:membrane hypothetical protein [Hyphomicrobiales bacterium]CAH1693010.1 membrane hypothetical protein [Hyphomicrobiales bacterium]
MADETALPASPELTDAVFAALEDKAKLPAGSMIVLGILAGVYIGLGGLFATVALAGANDLPFGVAQVLAGLVFTVGLALVLIAGAELFTGNTLMAGPLAAGRLKASSASRALGIVYISDFVGSLLLAGVVLLAGVHEAGLDVPRSISARRSLTNRSARRSRAASLPTFSSVLLCGWPTPAGR